MQTARHYRKDTARLMERAPKRMPVVTLAPVRPLPQAANEIYHYVDELLTAEEQKLCDSATD